MRICGIKASHDGGVAVIEDGRLLFSHEIEKLQNGERYSSLGNLERVTEILAAEGLSPADIDQFVVDGWYTKDAAGVTAVAVDAVGLPVRLRVAPYLETPDGDDGPLQRHTFSGHGLGDHASYTHVANHLIGTYCSSPFAARGEDAFVLVWDGIITPRRYRVRAATREVAFVEALMPVFGGSFAAFCARFEPYLPDTDDIASDRFIRRHLSVAGKGMAYAAQGRVETGAFAVFDDLMAEFRDIPVDRVGILGDEVAAHRDELMPGLSNADLIAAYQAYLGHNLLERLTTAVRRRFPGGGHNLVLGGGCALNIKWNTAIRASGVFQEVFVPPSPTTRVRRSARRPARCSATAGRRWSGTSTADRGSPPAPSPAGGAPGPATSGSWPLCCTPRTNRWSSCPAGGTGSASPVQPQHRRARDRHPDEGPAQRHQELGPVPAGRAHLPGGPRAGGLRPRHADPYMIFEHRMRPGWADRVPAIVHLDGTARLQTIASTQGTATVRILTAYAEISGVPVLCNTSANLEGRGFFPDVESAARWGGTRYIWSEGTLYTNQG